MTRLPVRLVPNPGRVIGQLFVPGHSLPGGSELRASGLVEHILDLSDGEVEEILAEVMERFGSRHHDLNEMFRHHAERIENRLPRGAKISEKRRLLLGATFTQEYAVEAASVCNPSAVPLPDQSGMPAGSLAIALSIRQIGEGHRSTIGFRRAVITEAGDVTVDEAGPFTTSGQVGASKLDGLVFRGLALLSKDDAEAITWVLDRLDDEFTVDQLQMRLTELESQRDTRRNVAKTVRRLREVAERTYSVSFPRTSDLSERVLHPATAIESNGMEDARFVRFTDDDGTVTYHASYTAYDGSGIAQQLLTTTDFLAWSSSPLLGAAAANKGLALFPRRIDGRFAALTRNDGATNAVAFSDDMKLWRTSTAMVFPTETWEVVQVGNCGPPIETAEGWLVLTHGVGPMRTYSIGARLLDLDDPTKVVRRLREPLFRPRPEEQNGYVPNVIYSCGGLIHRGTLMIPYGIGDASIGLATASVSDLLGAMS